jgi:hypothetical protein
MNRVEAIGMDAMMGARKWVVVAIAETGPGRE